ncbi:MAG: hypothetical protein ACJ74Y_14030 [Bryobacteraceae bacterium]|jgi:hypothetical protein
MSEETYEAVEEAIRIHMADENEGAFLTQWVVVAHAISATDSASSNYQYMSHKGPAHEKIGLLSLGMRWVDGPHRVTDNEDDD